MWHEMFLHVFNFFHTMAEVALYWNIFTGQKWVYSSKKLNNTENVIWYLFPVYASPGNQQFGLSTRNLKIKALLNVSLVHKNNTRVP